MTVYDNIKNHPGNHHMVIANWIAERNAGIFCEVGVFKGENLRNILNGPASKVIKEYYAVDQWKEDNEYWPGKTQKEWDAICRSTMECVSLFPQLKIVKMGSTEAAGLFRDGFFDFVYIDGDHRYKPVQDDIRAWLPKVRRGGILGGHDYFGWTKWNHQVKNAVNDFFGKGNFKRDLCSVWIKEIQ